MRRVHPTAIIYDGVVLEDDVYIGPYCVIGGKPEHREFWNGEETKGVIVKRGAKIFSFASVDAGTVRRTEIGEGAAIFNHSHVGHDSLVCGGATIGGAVSLAGHCIIMPGATVSGKSCLVQRCVVGAYSFLGGFSYLTRHLPPGEKWVGSNPRFVSSNSIGLSRAGLTYEECIDRYQKEYEQLTKECPL